MAAAFNLTAQINLQGPTNIKSIVSNVQKQINGAKLKLNLDVGANAAKNITSITSRLNSLSKAAINANANVATLSSTLSSLSKSFNTASSSATSNANSVAQTSKSVASAGKVLQQTRTQVEEFGKQAGLAVKRFAAFSAVTAPIYALTNAISSAFKEFVNFNKEIVRLSQVTGQSVADLSGVTKEITRLSTTLGVASSDLLTVATTLAQAGLSAEDTKVALEALAKSALAPSFESLTDTTEGAIAALRQFGLQTKELDGALGSINAVAAGFAVEAGDIITAIQRTGGVFSAASRGVSEGSDALNEFIAIFTSVRATTRESAETIATGLRTIFTRIQRVKTIEQLREFGIELQDTEGKFVGLFEATKRLSEGLSKIDPRTAEFATISEELGGFRQIGKVIPLIQQFAVAERALSVAQKGSTSTSKDALIAQQSLAVQFTKTRENFLALVREIGESTSFKAFVGVSLTLANAFINLGRSLKPLLPLLLTFASIKAGGAIREFGGGFGGVFGLGGNRGGGGAPPTGGTGGGGGAGGRGSGGAATAAIIGNTNVLNTVSQTLNTLNLSILALNQNIVNTNSLLLNRPTRGFATGGLVPGSGNRDTVRANLTPGEFVIRKSAVQAIGAQNLAAMNSGGEVQKFMAGSPGGVKRKGIDWKNLNQGRGKKVKKGARSRFDLPQPGDKDYLEWARRIYAEYDADPSLPRVMVNGVPMPPELAYADLLISQEVFERNGAGMMLGYDAKGNEVIGRFGRQKTKKPGKLKKTRLGLLISAADMKRGDRAPAGEMQKILGAYEKDPEYLRAIGKQGGTPSESLLNILKGPLSAFRQSGGQTSLAGIFPGKSRANIRAAIPQYIASLGSDEPQKVAKAKTALQYFDSFVGGGTAKKPGHATHFVETINQILKSGLVQEFAEGGKAQISDKLKQQIIKAGGYEQFISQNMFDPNSLGLNSQIANFGMVGLRSGTKSSANRIENRKLENGKRVRIHVGFLQSQNDPNFKSNIEDDINDSLQKTILKTAGKFGQSIDASIDPKTKNQILDGAVLSSAVGSVFESALQMIGAPYIDKIEAIKSMDFPFGLGTSSKLFGSFPDNIPTDATRTIAGSGKGISDFLGQINRFFTAVEGGKFTARGGLEALPTPQKLSARKMAESLFGSVKADPNTQSAINSILVGDRIPGVTRKQTTKRIDSLADNLERNPETMKKLEAAGYGVTRRATGGGISGEDTVPALLTPGEFVFNKDSAQRIGYGTLNKLNKIKGYNKGGVVGAQKFAGGGIVDNIGGNAGAIAAITAVILPEMEKLALSFQKLGGESSSLAAGLSGAAKEASSLVLSAGIALRTLGADRRTTGLTQAGVGVAGAVSGFITEKSTKDLEKALLKTSDQFGKFDKTLQDLTQAPTEELRVEAAARLEKNFMQLDNSVTNAVSSINTLETAQKIGESLNNFSMSVITGIAAISALKQATEGMTFAAQRQIVRASRAAAAGTAGPAIGLTTKFLAGFGKFIPYVGLAITAFSAVSEVVGFFTNSLKKSGEQFNKLYDSLDQLTKNSNAYNLANENFIKNILPQFRTLRGLDPEKTRERLGTVINDSGSLNELNLTFRTLVRSRFAEQGFTLRDTTSLSEFQAYVSQSANGLNVFNQVISDSIKEFEKEQFIRAKMASDSGITRDVAEAEFKRLANSGKAGRAEIEKTYKSFVGTKNLEILSLRDLTDANNRVKISLVNLDNILVSLSAKISSSINKAIDSFDDLDLKIATLRGEPEPIGGRFLRRDISVLENIGGATQQQIQDITNTVKGLIQLPGGADTDTTKRFGEIATQVQAVRIFQQDLPATLRQIQAAGQGTDVQKIGEELDTKLGDQLRTIAGKGNEEAVKTIIAEASASIFKAVQGQGETISNFDDLARNVPALAAALKNGETSVNTFKSVLEASAKLQDKLGEQQKRIIDLNNELNQSIIQRTQTELQNSIELKRIFGENISLDELNNVFESGIKRLTDVGGSIRAGGTTDVDAISAQLKKSKEYIQTLDEQIALTRNDQEITKDLTDDRTRESIIVNRLSQSLKTLATSTDTTKNAFDKIAESQNKFRTQRDIFFDFVRNSRNPEAALEQRRIMDSIRAAQAPGGPKFRDIEQALLFQEKGAAILKGFRPEADVEALLDATARSIAGQTPAFNLFDRISKAYLELFFTQRGRSPRLEQKLKESQENQRKAAQADEANIREQIGVVTNTTSDIFNSFNIDLANILPGIIINLNELSNKTQAAITTSKVEFLPPIGFRDEFKKALSSITRQESGPAFAIGPGGFSRPIASTVPILSQAEIDKFIQDLGASGDPTAVIRQATDRIKEKTRGAAPDTNLTNSLKKLSDLEAKMSDMQKSFELQQKEIGGTGAPSRSRFLNPSPQPQNNAPQNRRAPTGVDGASIQKFENSANTLSKSLNEAPLQNLSDSLGSFNTTATKLVSALKDFTSKFQDGMRGEIAYTGDISLNFNEPLAVNIPNNSANRNSLISDIDRRLAPTIRGAVETGIQKATLGS